ncbi:30S ribosomal protein S5, chloroplastic-like [Vigna angularis]|uniref:30S ribosomal protein S5, chloroplastic-like n=1 Tax=Phaseolus angularis TaxID=3914 RepID=UPI0022B4C324|nr:30S ribosomal protein S5, chloroplastic-like [Vigna angularis]
MRIWDFAIPFSQIQYCEIFSLPKPLDPNLNGGHFFAIPASSHFSLLPSPPHTVSLLFAKPQHHPFLLYAKCKPSDDIDTSDNVNPLEDIDFNPLEPAEGFVAPPSFDDGPLKTEDKIAATYEELYGPTFNGVSVLGNDVFEMDALVKRDTGFGSNSKKEKVRDGFKDRVVQVRRVTKVVKGGKQLRFRAVFIVGNKNGQDCIGVGKTKEVVAAIQKSASNAGRNIVKVPMTKYSTFPHRYTFSFCLECYSSFPHKYI